MHLNNLTESDLAKQPSFQLAKHIIKHKKVTKFTNSPAYQAQKVSKHLIFNNLIIIFTFVYLNNK